MVETAYFIDTNIVMYARDLIHAAVMLTNGIECIISTDAHFDLIKEVKRLDPVKL